MAEVMYRLGEAGPLEPPLALSAGELLCLDLPLDKVELGVEAFCLFVVSAVSLDLCEQPPVWEGCDAVAEGEIGRGGAFE